MLKSLQTGEEDSEGAGAKRCGTRWNAFQDPSRYTLRAQVLPQATVWGGVDC